MRQGGVLLWTVAAVCHMGPSVWSQEPPNGPSDWQLATVTAGKDRAPDIEQKLGASPCLLPSSTGATTSFLYNIKGKEGPLFLRLVVTDHVTSITISKDPPIAGVCYGPAREAIAPQTGKGLQLGATIEDVTGLYGIPAERFSVGPMTRFRYVTTYSRPFEWDLVFRDGRLVEWTVATQE